MEYMATDALLAADSVLDISGRVDNPEKFRFLTDAIIMEIAGSGDPVSIAEGRRTFALPTR